MSLTRLLRAGKQGRFGHLNRNKRNVTRSIVEKYTFYMVGHGMKLKQMRLCADFNAGAE